MRDRTERGLSAVLTVAAVVIAVALVHREFFPAAGARASAAPQGPPVYLADWKDLLAGSVVLGDSNATVQVIEFTDLECPFCKRFNAVVRSVRAKYGRGVSLAVVHLPLEMHRFARPAARAVECAGAESRFESLFNLIYEKQDSLGLKSWGSFAAEAGVRDTAAFLRCAAVATPNPRIERGVALANKVGATGTPTVFVNGWRYASPPDQAELDRVVSVLLSGKNPFEVAK